MAEPSSSFGYTIGQPPSSAPPGVSQQAPQWPTGASTTAFSYEGFMNMMPTPLSMLSFTNPSVPTYPPTPSYDPSIALPSSAGFGQTNGYNFMGSYNPFSYPWPSPYLPVYSQNPSSNEQSYPPTPSQATPPISNLNLPTPSSPYSTITNVKTNLDKCVVLLRPLVAATQIWTTTSHDRFFRYWFCSAYNLPDKAVVQSNIMIRENTAIGMLILDEKKTADSVLSTKFEGDTKGIILKSGKKLILECYPTVLAQLGSDTKPSGDVNEAINAITEVRKQDGPKSAPALFTNFWAPQ